MNDDPTAHRADEIVADNIRAVGAIYMAWQLEELRLFDVVDRLVKRFMQGMLSIRDDSGAEALEQYYRDRDERLTRQERFAVYARVLGAPGADSAQAASNRDVDSLWRRFLSTVADHNHQRRIATRSGAQSPSITRDHVRSAARRLAANATAAVSSVSELAVRRLIDQTLPQGDPVRQHRPAAARSQNTARATGAGAGSRPR